MDAKIEKPMSDKTEELAAIKIQSAVRRFFSQKKTNIYGQSEGKEIEVYLPFGVRKIGKKSYSYDMPGKYKYIVCESDLFYIQIDYMNFKGRRRYKIPEIVTTPFRKSGEVDTNLPMEEFIDEAIGDLLFLLEEFTQKAASQKEVAYLPLNDLIQQYNEKHPTHPLRLTKHLKEYLANPEYEEVLTNKVNIVKEHKDVEICFIYDRNYTPVFDTDLTPRTPNAAEIVSKNEYIKGKLLVHIQKTFSLPIEKYKPGVCHKGFHLTEQQLSFMQEAYERAENFIKVHPLPPEANQNRILGLLTVCAEHIISLSCAKQYVGLHEKADRPILSIRHILHYLKKKVCNAMECAWFDNMYRHHRQDIQAILCKNDYTPDYRGNGTYGNANGLSQSERYDVIFDLFGDFSNGIELSNDDLNNPLTLEELQEMKAYGITSWEKILENHSSLTGRTHLRLQKVFNSNGDTQYDPLFEARRIGLITILEFKGGRSRLSLTESSENSLRLW
jgi:hypothetical protein